MARTWRMAAVHVAFVAMLLRALLPVGWMPSGTAETPITICSIDGPIHLVVGPDGRSKKPAQDDGRQHDVCPFTAAPHMATPTTLGAVSPPKTIAVAAIDAIAQRTATGTAVYSSHSPRAPPASA